MAASIDAMSLRGIRSFSPGEVQSIKFFQPLTVIVGSNGCGKTTIIEALKYMTTGAVPPDSKSGQSFIHDPKLARTTEVKAQLKLKFKDRSGTVMMCHRQFQLTQLKKTMRFKALDCVLTRTDKKTKKTKRISKRCTDMDGLMPELIGVSKAVLQHVVFCHQEESSWPLQEGVALKKKFDEIFESTRYTKALHDLQDQRKKYKNDIKALEVDHGAKSDLAQRETRLRSQLADLQTEDATMDGDREELAERLEKAEEEHARLVGIKAELEDEIHQLELDRRQMQSLIHEVDKLTDDGRVRRYKESDADIQKLLKESGARLRQLGRNQAKNVRDLKDTREQMRSLRNKQADIAKSQGKIHQQRAQLREALQELNTLAEKAAGHHGVAGWRRMEEYNHERFSTLLTALSAEQTRQRDDVKRLRERNKARLQAGNQKANDAVVQYNKIEQAMKAEERTQNNKRRQAANLKQQLRGSTQGLEARAEIGLCDDKIRQTNARLTQLKREGMGDDEAEKVRSINSRKLEANANEREKLRTMLAEIRAQDGERTKLKQADAALAAEEAKLKRLVANSHSAFAKALRDVPDPLELLGVVQRLIHKREDEVTTQRRSLAKEERQRDKLAGQLEAIVLTASSQEKDVRRIRASDGFKLLQATAEERDCGIDGLLETVRSELEAVASKMARTKYLAKALTYFANQGRREQACPLCKSSLKRAAMMETFIQTTEEMVPEAETAYKAQKKELTALLARCTKAMPQFHALTSANRDLERGKQSKVALQRNLQAYEERVQSAKKDLEAATSRKAAATRLLDDARAIDEAARAKSKAEDTKARCRRTVERLGAGVSVHLTVEGAEAKLQELERARDELTQQREEFAMQQARFQKKQQELQREILAHQNKKIKLEKQQERRNQLLRDLERLSKEEDQAASQRDAHKAKLPELKRRMQLAKQELDQLTAELRQEEDEARKNLQDVSQRARTLKGHGARVQRLDQACSKRAGDAIDEEMARLDKRLEEAQNQLAKLEKETNQINELVAKADNTKYIMEKELSIREKEAQLEAIQERLQKSNAELEEQAGGELDRKIAKAAATVQAMVADASRAEGRGEQLKRQISDLEETLNEPTLRHIHREKRNALIKLETTKLAVLDLERYHAALDNALMRYHSMKIQDINRIIRDYWTMTYKGGDIDTIEIRSDVDGKKNARGRSYNYRVVMRKGTAELDMKGRCSAGQKVLASLVIRLALAETFCLTCGILALDEPTTNLDEANKIGFASALAAIIAQRADQENFQLIMITHDEEFVKMLQMEMDKLDCYGGSPYYYLLTREQVDDSGVYHSKIHQQDWE